MRERIPQVAIPLIPVHRSATGIPPLFFRDRMRALLALVRDQERLGIMRRVAIDQYRITASIAPQMSIITSRNEAVRDGTKD